MKKLSVLFLSVLFMVCIQGCAKMTPPEMLASLDYGPEPVNYRAAVEAYVRTIENIHQYKIVKEPPVQYCAEVMTMFEEEPKHGWAVEVEIDTALYRKPIAGYETVTYEDHGKIKTYEKIVWGSPILTGYRVDLCRLYLMGNQVVSNEHIKQIRTYYE